MELCPVADMSKPDRRNAKQPEQALQRGISNADNP